MVCTLPMAPSQIHSQKHADGVEGVPLVAHLRDDLVLLGGLHQLADLVDRVRQRLLAVDVLAALDGGHGGHRVGMVGRGDDDRVDLLVHLVEHLAEVAELLGLGIVLEGVGGASCRSPRRTAPRCCCRRRRCPRRRPPCPPTPMPAMFSFSLGGVWPLCATAWRGTIITAAAPAAEATNSLRVTTGFFFIDLSLSVGKVCPLVENAGVGMEPAGWTNGPSPVLQSGRLTGGPVQKSMSYTARGLKSLLVGAN